MSLSEENISEEIRTLNTDTINAIFKPEAPPITLGGEGVILPCLELCNIGKNLQSQTKLNIINQNGRLYIQPDLDATSSSTMFPCYSSIKMCNEESASKEDLFTLVNIIITCPSLHKVTTSSGNKIYDGEVFMIFENTSNTNINYKVLCSFLSTTDSAATAADNDSLESYTLFTNITDNMPEKDNMEEITLNWDLSDLLPKTKTFFNYFHPENTRVSMYVYKDPLYVPENFKYTFVDTVSQAVNQSQTVITGSDAYNYIYNTIGTITNPPNFGNDFYIYYHRDPSEIYSTTATSLSTSGSTSSSSSSGSSSSANGNSQTPSAESCASLLDGSSVTTTTTTTIKTTNYGTVNADRSTTDESGVSSSTGSTTSNTGSTTSSTGSATSNTSESSSSSETVMAESSSTKTEKSEEADIIEAQAELPTRSVGLSVVSGIIFLSLTLFLASLMVKIFKTLRVCGANELFYNVTDSKTMFFILYIACMIVYNSFYTLYTTVYAITNGAMFIINSILFSICDLGLVVFLIALIVMALKKN